MKDCNKKSVEKADSIDELATLICGYGYYANHNDDRNHPIPKDAVKEYLEMGASFARQQMMKDAVSAEVNYWNQRGLSIRLEDINVEDLAEEGDKMKLIIIKEE